MTDVVIVQTPDDSTQVALELDAPHMMWSHHHSSSFLAATGRDNNPVTNAQVVLVRTKVVDAPGISEADAYGALRRRTVVIAEDLVAFFATTSTNCFTRLEAALEPFPGAGARFVDRRRW
ncbi:MAG TPA: hypothetical protein VK356_14455 [Thermomicrobiales bacterium]|nr:hypothetical protein [Thermomicrobiales bacterium]